MTFDSAAEVLLEAYHIPVDSTKSYECGCALHGTIHDIDTGLDYAAWWLVSCGDSLSIEDKAYFFDSEAYLCTVWVAEGLFDSLLEFGWCKEHASQVMAELQPAFIFESGRGVSPKAEWFDSLETAQQKWNNYMTTLNEVLA